MPACHSPPRRRRRRPPLLCPYDFLSRGRGTATHGARPAARGAHSPAGLLALSSRGGAWGCVVALTGDRLYQPVSVRNGGPHHPGVTYRTTATYPYIANGDRALAALRGNLRVAAARDGAVPDWSTLHVTGPTEVVGARGFVWYEWAATVDSQEIPATNV